MKKCFDKDAVFRSFEKGDQVLVLSQAMLCRLWSFQDPMSWIRNSVTLIILLVPPDQQRKTRVCHINMLKRYIAQGKGEESKSSVFPVACSVLVLPTSMNEDGIYLWSMPTSGFRLNNSEILSDLNSHLLHLTEDLKADILSLIQSFFGVVFWCSDSNKCT